MPSATLSRTADLKRAEGKAGKCWREFDEMDEIRLDVDDFKQDHTSPPAPGSQDVAMRGFAESHVSSRSSHHRAEEEHHCLEYRVLFLNSHVCILMYSHFRACHTGFSRHHASYPVAIAAMWKAMLPDYNIRLEAEV